MIKTVECTECGGTAVKNNMTGNYKCENCGSVYGKRANCDVCGNELEKLSACGAAQFFCNTCNELKSSKGLKLFVKKLK